VRRRLLDQLQQGIEGGIGELMRLVEDVDLVPALDRLEHDPLADLANVVDSSLRGGVHLDDVQRGSVGDCDARVARLVRRRCRPLGAVQRLGENPRERRLSRPARSSKEVGLPNLAGLDRVAERLHDRLLTDDLVEVLRAVFAVEGGHRDVTPIESEPDRAPSVVSVSEPVQQALARARPTHGT
jgi:hypothetical protein